MGVMNRNRQRIQPRWLVCVVVCTAWAAFGLVGCAKPSSVTTTQVTCPNGQTVQTNGSCSPTEAPVTFPPTPTIPPLATTSTMSSTTTSRTTPAPVPGTRTGPLPRPGPGTSDRPRPLFSRDSFWYADVRKAPLAANSAAIVKNIKYQTEHFYATANRPNLAINITEYTPPFYYVDADTPRYNVKHYDCFKQGWVPDGWETQMNNVPIPTWALPSKGSDKEIGIYDKSTDTLWELWLFDKRNGSYSACWGGKISPVSHNVGAFTYPWGCTATGLSLFGGTIMADELKAGVINHAIGLALPNAQHGSLSWPAMRGDGYNPSDDPTAPRQGQRFRLDPTVDLSTMKLNPITRILAETAQKYGFVLWDTSGAVSLRAENAIGLTSLGQPNPYPSIFGPIPQYEQLADFPWSLLQAIQVDWGKPAR